MGTMTVSATPKAFLNTGGAAKRAVLTFTGSNSYATGGDTMPNLSTSGNLGQALGFVTVTENRSGGRHVMDRLEEWLVEEFPDLEQVEVEIEER